jgi:hypothetical protein
VKTIRWVDINSEQAFKERVAFRAQRCLSVPQSHPDRSIDARLMLQQGVDLDDLENYVRYHGFKVRMFVEPRTYSTDKDQELLQASPFISATSDLLRALNHGRKLRNARYQDVCLVMIDLWEMPKGACGKCNTIRRKLKLSENNVYKTEILIWQEIPPNAILSIASFEELSTGIFGQCFSTVFKPFTLVPELKLPDLRIEIARTATKVDLSPQVLCYLLTEELRLGPCWLLTRQVGQALLESYMKSESDTLKHLDISLYYVECQRRIQKAACFMGKAILKQCNPKSAARLASAFTLPNLSSWVASRAEQNIISYDDSALTHSEQIDLLRYAEKWTGSHVYA